MAEPPELWLFLLSNLTVLAMGGILTAVSTRAFLRSRRRSFRGAMVGFGLITLGSIVEGVYELGIRGTYELGGRELLVLHSIEGIVITIGLGAFFYTIKQY